MDPFTEKELIDTLKSIANSLNAIKEEISELNTAIRESSEIGYGYDEENEEDEEEEEDEDLEEVIVEEIEDDGEEEEKGGEEESENDEAGF